MFQNFMRVATLTAGLLGPKLVQAHGAEELRSNTGELTQFVELGDRNVGFIAEKLAHSGASSDDIAKMITDYIAANGSAEGLELWTANDIEKAFTNSLDHHQGDEIIVEFAELKDMCKQFEKFGTSKGNSTNSAYEAIENMFKNLGNYVDANRESGRTFDLIRDPGLQALGALKRAGTINDADYNSLVTQAKISWHEGFVSFANGSFTAILEDHRDAAGKPAANCASLTPLTP